MPRKIYLVAHYGAYKAFEDYCVGLVSLLKGTTTVVFHDESEIPVPTQSDDTYLFFSYIPPKFYRYHISGKYNHIHLINTEQSTREIWKVMLQHYTKHKIQIYDYDLYQAQKRSDDCGYMGLKYIPYQITEKENKYLTNLIAESPKYYNVAICSVNQSRRRANIYNQLESRGVKVIDVSGWKEERDRKIAQAQMLINIHYDSEYQIFEHFRCDRWILAGMLTVSERSLSDSVLDCKDLVIFEDYQYIVNKIIEIIANYDRHYQQYLEKLSLSGNQIINDRRQKLTQFTK